MSARRKKAALHAKAPNPRSIWGANLVGSILVVRKGQVAALA